MNRTEAIELVRSYTIAAYDTAHVDSRVNVKRQDQLANQLIKALSSEDATREDIRRATAA